MGYNSFIILFWGGGRWSNGCWFNTGFWLLMVNRHLLPDLCLSSCRILDICSDLKNLCDSLYLVLILAGLCNFLEAAFREKEILLDWYSGVNLVEVGCRCVRRCLGLRSSRICRCPGVLFLQALFDAFIGPLSVESNLRCNLNVCDWDFLIVGLY